MFIMSTDGQFIVNLVIYVECDWTEKTRGGCGRGCVPTPHPQWWGGVPSGVTGVQTPGAIAR